MLALGLLLSGSAAAGTSRLELPTPEAARLAQNDLLAQLGAPPDRLLPSRVPGPVVDDEVVRVGLGGDGTVRTVALDQRLRLTGTGDYQVRERGPARSATPLGSEPPPVTRRGAVVWQGFSPGRRDLGARLVLDPVLEAPRLPLKVALTFTPPGGRATPLLDGGRLPGRGTVTVTVTVTTAQPTRLPTAADAPAAALAGPLDLARAAARRTDGQRLPTTGGGLPASVAATAPAAVDGVSAVPLRLSGALHLIGTTGRVSGPATVPTADGATFAGTTSAGVTFRVAVDGPGTLGLELRAVPALDARTLVPPRGLRTWAAWAAAGPPAPERRTALDLLVQVAATGARATSYSPYLGAELAGTGTTAFELALVPAVRPAAVSRALTPRPVPIALAGLGLLLLLSGSVAVWRRS